MTELTPIVVTLAALISAVYGVVHGNLAAVFNLFAPILQLRTLDFSKLKGDLLTLTAEDRAKLEAQFNAALSIPDPSVLLKIQGGASVLDGAVTLAEDVVTSATQFYGRALALIAKVKSIFGTTAGVKFGLTLPPWLHLPSWVPSWLGPTLLSVLTSVILPALATALPAETGLINDLILFLRGGQASPRLKAAHAHYHATKP